LEKRDKELGVCRQITRRDFLNGVAVAAGSALFPFTSSALTRARETRKNSAEYYPPALTGLRGSHPGSFEVMHAVRDGDFWSSASSPENTGESYDLVIVGGGISGLSAAHFFRKAAGDQSRILVLDNHDDFGGHAKRNEFQVGNRRLLGFGGTFSIESPAPYSAVAKGLIEELQIDVPSYSRFFNKDLYRAQGMRRGLFFDKETFGADRLVPDPTTSHVGETGDHGKLDSDLWKKFLTEAPLSRRGKEDYQRLHQEKKDYYPGLNSDEKKARLARISYAKYLREVVGVGDEVVRIYQAFPHPLFGVGIDAVSAQDAWGLGLPGFSGLNLAPGAGKGMNRDAIPNEEAERYFFHFPDGNASIARLIVRSLIPKAIPGNVWTDVVSAQANYSQLDDGRSPVRIRLNSTVVRVKHVSDKSAAQQVEITYVTAGKLKTLRASSCVLACWHVVIPYICEELPDQQKEALASAQKVPLLYTNVAVSDWKSCRKLGVNSVYAPGSYHTGFNLDLPVSIGGYQCSQSPEDPIVIHMMKTPNRPGLPAREQHRIGRAELFATSFETIERKIRDQLARTLGAGGFDPARDITAITVNRWPHGYAYEYNSLFDKFWLEGGEAPCEIARRPFGRIAIANADADAYAYTDCAIDQGYRAVQELTRKS